MIASAPILVPGAGPYLIAGVWALIAVIGFVAGAVSRPHRDTILNRQDLRNQNEKDAEASFASVDRQTAV